MIRQKMINIINRPIGISIGDNTHHHDQVTTLVSFSPIKRRVNNPPNPIPFDAVDSLLMFSILFFKLLY